MTSFRKKKGGKNCLFDSNGATWLLYRLVDFFIELLNIFLLCFSVMDFLIWEMMCALHAGVEYLKFIWFFSTCDAWNHWPFSLFGRHSFGVPIFIQFNELHILNQTYIWRNDKTERKQRLSSKLPNKFPVISIISTFTKNL